MKSPSVNIKSLLFVLIFSLFSSCKKFVDVTSPKTQLTNTSVFTSDATAIAAQLAIYSQMESQGLAYYLIIYSGMSADELTNYSSLSDDVDMATNNLTPSNLNVLNIWTNFYQYIYEANSMLDGLSGSSGISPSVERQLAGEAKFVRAFCNFYLVNLFGDIPIVRSTDYSINAALARSPVPDVYNSIIDDLQSADSLLSDSYMSGTNGLTDDRVRPNKWTAAALLARVYLYQNRWSDAEIQASRVIEKTNLYTLASDLNNVFLTDSPEAIWQWMAVDPETQDTYPGSLLILTGTPEAVALDTSFVNSFQTNDNRRLDWINVINDGTFDYYFPFKYKMGQSPPAITEYTTVLRLGEQLLIRSEARAMQNKFDGAMNDLNMIRSRAGLDVVSNLSQTDLLDSLQEERKRELFTEFGDRWFNLKRTGQVDSVIQNIKGSNWTSTDKLYPIPQSEILRDRNLTQNPGY